MTMSYRKSVTIKATSSRITLHFVFPHDPYLVGISGRVATK